MKILSITAQKPHSTGSGVYLSELVKALDSLGASQAVIAGISPGDQVSLPRGVGFYPVVFGGEDVSFDIVGMSDEMPYKSTRYRDLSGEMAEEFRRVFVGRIMEAVADFSPDLILCHHLYFLTAIVCDEIRDIPICAFSHNTDIRQLEKIDFQRTYIIENMRRAERIFALHDENKHQIEKIFDVPAARISTLGMGYNSDVFFTESDRETEKTHTLIYAGKIAEKKGVMCLVKALDRLPYKENELELLLAGGAGNREEYERIRGLACASRYPCIFTGSIPQKELAILYRKSRVFVLPSFCEGLPLTMIEALACGCRAVVTGLPGIEEWAKKNVRGGCLRFIAPPRMTDTDVPFPEDLEKFEGDIAEGITLALEEERTSPADVSSLSWENIAKEVMAHDY